MSRRTTLPTPTGVRVTLDPAAEAYAFVGPGQPLERIAVTEVTLREGEVLVEVELATVCGSDLHTALGHRAVPTPQVLGHEQVGRVVALGSGDPAVTLDGIPLSVGDRIVWGVAIDCGDCAMCARGLPNKCERLQKYGHERVRRGWELSGGIATHVHLLARTWIVRARDWIPAAVLAPASCATATVAAVVEAAEQIRPLAGETVLVSGCGMLGLTAVAMATERGAHVVAIDGDPRRRTLAREFGAVSAHSPGHAPTGHGVALELSGASSAVADVIAGAGVGGVVVLAGSVFDAPPVAVEAESVVRRLLTIRGVHNYRPEHLQDAVRFLERADHDLFARLVGETVPFAEAPRALTTAAVIGVRTAVRP
jgi:putative phosphonate catabolism associated alcohol dehydrogenase